MKAAVEGVYFLYSGDELVYVGQSKNVWERIGQHLTEGTKEFDSFDVYETPDRLELEAFLIRFLRPKYNVSGTPEHSSHIMKEEQIKEDQFFNLEIDKIIDIYKGTKRAFSIERLAKNRGIRKGQMFEVLFQHKDEMPIWKVKGVWYIDYEWYMQNYKLVDEWINDIMPEPKRVCYGGDELACKFDLPVLDFIPKGWEVVQGAPESPAEYRWYSNSFDQWETIFMCALIPENIEKDTVDVFDEDNKEIDAFSKQAVLNVDSIPDGWRLYYRKMLADGTYNYYVNTDSVFDKNFKYCLVKEKRKRT